ncbi:3-oxoacyl-[acyl-carrier-protein] reductase [Hathewaya limosa]|uniref:3-oxoacyl-[acyl-carrier-protein] reductase n=1 Tax=Hathewaya limosa TaxID=1536 RepID=A0ABU0JUK7_HATLI|nr:3-oxoacyl-[acyl-carrier-protein] reductase [Hathewaya limosa]MDQ0480749.1 3-oxoacyl-[acyl-carrier protein] reductase [Hathewaya limosa]
MKENKVAIVTGGSRGIGKAIALRLAEKGFNIVVNYRKDNEALLQFIKEIESKGVTAMTIKADVSNFNSVEEMFKQVMQHYGRIDVLVNNAGITKDTLLMRMKEEDFDSVIDVNLKGTFNCVRQVTPIMLKQKGGRVINISSVVGEVGNAGQVNYASSKAGIIGLTKSLAKELGSRGITVNAIAPGFIKTDMTDVLSDRVKEDIKNNIPLRKMGEARDVANLVAFLSSEDASYITGQVINVDGGMVM